MNEEEWRDVVGYEGLYEVSDRGRVRRHINDKPYCNTSPGKMLAMDLSGNGYHRYPLWRWCKAVKLMSHRIVMAAFVGECPSGWQVNHIDGNKLNNNIGNLEYVTGSYNLKHAFKNGLKTPMLGDSHGASKLTEGEARIILNSDQEGVVLAGKYNVSQSTICDIRHRRTWRHIKKTS